MIKNNIVLCGFMGCGKTTVGKALAELLQMDFIDLDLFIEEKEGKTVSEIFARHGEEYFRNAETEAARLLGSSDNKVIACGGGTVLKKENVEALKKNGSIFYLFTDADTVKARLKNDTSRPLLAKDKENTINELLEKRKPIYEAAADFTVDATADKNRTVNQILNLLED